MKFTRSFFRWTAVCSLLAGILGLLALLLDFGYESSSEFELQMSLKDNPYFMGRNWAVLTMMIFTLIAFWGVTVARLNTSAGSGTTAFIFFFIYCLISIILATTGIFTVYENWATKYLNETNENAKKEIQERVELYSDISAGLVFLLLLTLIAGTLLYGISCWKGGMSAKVASICFLFNCLASTVWTVVFYVKLSWLVTPMTWGTRILWVILFFMISVWLWRRKAEDAT